MWVFLVGGGLAWFLRVVDDCAADSDVAMGWATAKHERVGSKEGWVGGGHPHKPFVESETRHSLLFLPPICVVLQGP